jgi:hypothetical protein
MIYYHSYNHKYILKKRINGMPPKTTTKTNNEDVETPSNIFCLFEEK